MYLNWISMVYRNQLNKWVEISLTISTVPGTLSFVVGDIAGKGLPAAMLMAITRTVIRTETNTRLYMTPASLLKSANFELYEDFSQLGLFATLFIGQYQSSTQELFYANAGHSPVIYCPAGEKARMLEADGTAIGILPDLSSFDHRVSFRPGDVLVVGTDGLVEARDHKDNRFGYTRFLQMVETLAHKSAIEIVESIFLECERVRTGRTARRRSNIARD
jgi:phosphoserine phosphatase RsbU/P